ncbi:4Fe-4S dicluster domain-containing protein [Xiamenia xianingshaonis]|uniref:4Fe-4S dicluster domain-containing protein n=1 Tax=Xiamenia xianingshaonis TaxID=2682776 RepID=A0A9E6MS68_9ACTN|nr:4Fe-4S dicluster domain-containing protein [Xiamenia xianingshaonis]NHM14589.1 4Fe-4S ferredoxin [Xiamenia xianingshaonis]NHM16094.1 4Fe-4S ferredoxin [Xiamenia xianingshaonis]QTU84964.1 4Fe-4S dicluster domain-containing protein [Xiamenia xianingshaonis]
MLYRVIDAQDLPGLVAAFMERHEVVAPVRRGSKHVFDVISSPDEIDLDYTTTVASPKKYLLPPRETLMAYNAETNRIREYEAEITPRVIFGAHPCDINAINRLDQVFLESPYADPYYAARRKATLVVGLSCMPDDTCFCHLWDSDEARFGYDLFLQSLGDRYLVSISSVEAANILEASCDVREATDADRIDFRHATRRRQDAFNQDIPDIQEVAMLMDAFHSDPYWAELGGRCLSCTACSAVCPTCYCFDIEDVLAPDGKTGVRDRIWDSCTAPQFAEVAGGHNFRPDGRNRVRHRMYHKLNGFLAAHDRMLCVGCGRCVTACKANINPIEVLNFFKAKGSDDALDAEGDPAGTQAKEA